MKIEVGKFYKTRDGRKVRIYATNNGGKWPIHGAYLYNERKQEWQHITWETDGSYNSIDNDCESELDIISEWEEPIKLCSCGGKIDAHKKECPEYKTEASNVIIEKTNNIQPRKGLQAIAVKCECGAEKCGFTVHAFYCPKYVESF